MAGVVFFGSLECAVRAGYQVVERNNSGYLVAKETPYGKALAVVTFVVERSTAAFRPAPREETMGATPARSGVVRVLQSGV